MYRTGVLNGLDWCVVCTGLVCCMYWTGVMYVLDWCVEWTGLVCCMYWTGVLYVLDRCDVCTGLVCCMYWTGVMYVLGWYIGLVWFQYIHVQCSTIFAFSNISFEPFKL